MHSNFFVSLDAKGTDRILGLGLNGLLVRQIFKHFSSLGEFIARLTSAQVQDQFVDLDVSHLVVLFGGVLLLIHIFFLNQLNLLIIIVAERQFDKKTLFDTDALFLFFHS